MIEHDNLWKVFEQMAESCDENENDSSVNSILHSLLESCWYESYN